jgi:hypothetical protein
MNDETQSDPNGQTPAKEGEGTTVSNADGGETAPEEKPDVFLTELREGDQPGHNTER